MRQIERRLGSCVRVIVCSYVRAHQPLAFILGIIFQQHLRPKLPVAHVRISRLVVEVAQVFANPEHIDVFVVVVRRRHPVELSVLVDRTHFLAREETSELGLDADDEADLVC